MAFIASLFCQETQNSRLSVVKGGLTRSRTSHKMGAMSDDNNEAVEEEPGASGPNEGDDEVLDESSTTRIPINPAIFEAIIPFRDLQRTIAASDFSGLRVAQQAVAATKLPILSAFQSDIQAKIAQSVDFGALAGVQRSLIAASAVSSIQQQTKWVQELANSLDFGALQHINEVLVATNFPAYVTAVHAWKAPEEWLKSFSMINIKVLLEGRDRWLPDNLKEIEDLESVAKLALEEGLPLSWIPRPNIVQKLIDAERPEDRLALLDSYQDDIIKDCYAVLVGVPHQWARECEDALRAFQVPLHGPAQSHAAGIIDSIVLLTLGAKGGRELAKERASEDWKGLALRTVGEGLVLRPLYKALVTWYPNGEMPPPDHFARHTTAHAVGQPGLFQPSYALVAVMLAVSLSVQFWDDPTAAGGVLASPEESARENGLD